MSYGIFDFCLCARPGCVHPSCLTLSIASPFSVSPVFLLLTNLLNTTLKSPSLCVLRDFYVAVDHINADYFVYFRLWHLSWTFCRYSLDDDRFSADAGFIIAHTYTQRHRRIHSLVGEIEEYTPRPLASPHFHCENVNWVNGIR